MSVGTIGVVTDESFPPHSWLGYGLDMTALTAIDITLVTQSVLKLIRMINMKQLGTYQKFNDDLITWVVPRGVGVAKDVNTSGTSYNSYKSGTSAANAIEQDASIGIKYMAVEAGASAKSSVSRSFTEETQYALFGFNQNLLQVSFQDYVGEFDVIGLLQRIKNVPKFDPNSPVPAVVSQYQSLFRTIGSHIITGTSYGCRYQLTVQATNSNSTQTEKFNTNVSVAYKGLTTSGEFDASVAESSEYKEFFESKMETCSCQGGDLELASQIADPKTTDIYNKFQTWVGTARTNPSVMSMQIKSLWDLMAASNNKKLLELAPSVQSAFNWIVANPAKHHTSCRFVISSDWGEICLLSAKTFTLKDPASPPPTDNVYFGDTKITWGREHSYKYERDVIIDFIIENDGSPIDINLSHGSNGASEGGGQCSVTIYGKEFQNAQITDNNWNTVQYYKIEVDPIEVPTLEDGDMDNTALAS